MQQFLLTGVLSGLRGRSFHAVLVLGLVLIGLAFLSGSFSPRQPKTVALDVGLSGLRFCLVLLNLFWVQELVTREIERKSVLFSLAYPVSRSAFLLGRLAAVVILSSLASAVLGMLLLLAVVFAGGNYVQEYPVQLGLPYVVTLAGLTLDAALVATFALCIAALSTVAMLPIALGAAFAVGGKALGAALDYIRSGADGDARLVANYGPALDIVQWAIPDLSRLDWRDWALYGLAPADGQIALAVLSAAVYALLLGALAVLLFSRREFS